VISNVDVAIDLHVCRRGIAVDLKRRCFSLRDLLRTLVRFAERMRFQRGMVGHAPLVRLVHPRTDVVVALPRLRRASVFLAHPFRVAVLQLLALPGRRRRPDRRRDLVRVQVPQRRCSDFGDVGQEALWGGIVPEISHVPHISEKTLPWHLVQQDSSRTLLPEDLTTFIEGLTTFITLILSAARCFSLVFPAKCHRPFLSTIDTNLDNGAQHFGQ